MASPITSYPRGEPVVIAWLETEGDSSEITNHRAVVKRATTGGAVPGDTSDPLGEFVFTRREAEGEIAAGYDAVFDTAALEPGEYVANFLWGAGGVVQEISYPVFFTVTESTARSFA